MGLKIKNLLKQAWQIFFVLNSSYEGRFILEPKGVKLYYFQNQKTSFQDFM
jgi:hypothetical protein